MHLQCIFHTVMSLANHLPLVAGSLWESYQRGNRCLLMIIFVFIPYSMDTVIIFDLKKSVLTIIIFTLYDYLLLGIEPVGLG